MDSIPNFVEYRTLIYRAGGLDWLTWWPTYDPPNLVDRIQGVIKTKVQEAENDAS